MPIFEFRCKNCGTMHSKIMSHNDIPQFEANGICKKCNSKSLKRVFSKFAVKFVGNGFAVNDSKEQEPPDEDDIKFDFMD